MRILLYNSTAENNRVDKTNYLEEFLIINGNLREQTSIVNPSIMVELKDYASTKFIVESNNINVVDDDGNILVSISNYVKQGYVVDSNNMNIIDSDGNAITYQKVLTDILLQANYCYIPDFKRYYFIKDIISVGKYLWRINMTTDSLMSYKDEILNLSCFVGRNEYEYNTMIKDDMVSYLYDKIVNEETITIQGSKANYEFNSTLSTDSVCYVVSVMNKGSVRPNATTSYSPTNILPNVNSAQTGSTSFFSNYVTSLPYINSLSWSLIEDDTLSTFVLSIMCFPFEIPHSVDTHSLKLGKITLDGTEQEGLPRYNCSVYDLTYQASQYLVIADFTIKGETFLDYEPYTRYEIYLPYCSWVEVEASQILNNRLLVIYVVDYETGSSQVMIVDDTNNKLIYVSSAQLGVRIPINSTNNYEVEMTRLNNKIQLATNIMSSVINLGGAEETARYGHLTGNDLMQGYGIISGAKAVGGIGSAIGNYIQNENTNYYKANGSINTSNLGVYTPEYVRVRKTKLQPRGYNTDYFHLVGRPLNAIKTLKDLKGYTKVGECNVNIDNALDSEKEIIANSLINGVYLEDK